MALTITGHFDIAVLGGGAAGLMAAACAARASGGKAAVAVIEKEPRVGKKLLVTGNGRCNLSNEQITRGDYSGSFSDGAAELFKAYGCTYIRELFQTLGLYTKTDASGRVYPMSNTASSVLDVLRLQLQKYGVKEVCNTEITKITREKGRFVLHAAGNAFSAGTLIVTTGGKAGVKNGSAGYPLLKPLGHTCTPLFPSLVPIPVKESVLRSLKGQRCACTAALRCGGKTVAKEEGELQFTEAALSGICLFQLSRYTGEFFTLHTVNGTPAPRISLVIDLLPGIPYQALYRELSSRCSNAAPLEQLFTGILSKRLSLALIKDCALSPAIPLNGLTAPQLKTLCSRVKGWEFTPCAPGTFQNAQVTAGGVPAGEVEMNTMASKIHNNLYFAGEILDLDGKCGGYNLHWAWVSGMLAGKNAAEKAGAHK